MKENEKTVITMVDVLSLVAQRNRIESKRLRYELYFCFAMMVGMLNDIGSGPNYFDMAITVFFFCLALVASYAGKKLEADLDAVDWSFIEVQREASKQCQTSLEP